MNENWTQLDEARRLSFTGHLLVEEGSGARLLWDAEAGVHAAELLRNRDARLEDVLISLNGGFSGVITGPAETILFTDRYGTHPLYFRIEKNSLKYSDSILGVIGGCERRSGLNESAALALMSGEFIPGSQTLANGVEQVCTGEIVRFRTDEPIGVSRSRYWRATISGGDGSPESALEEEFGALLRTWGNQWAQALLESIPESSDIGIPLSGGLDSRLLLASLAGYDRNRIHPCCYGDPQSSDVRLSRLAAERLGLKHTHLPFVDGSPLMGESRSKLVQLIGGTTRLTLADGGLVLAEHLSAPRGNVGVFVPGHSGDVVSGSKLKPSQSHRGTIAAEDFAASYCACFHPKDLAGLLLPQKRELSTAAIDLFRASARTSNEADEAIHRWSLEELIHRRVNTELVIYRQTSKAVTPFFDSRLADFFARTPRESLYGQRLYIRVAGSQIFTGKMEPLAHIPLQGRGGSPRDLASRGGGVTIQRRVFNRIVRKLNPSAYERSQSACPMMYLWTHSGALRESVWHELRHAVVLPELFDMNALLEYLERRAGRDYHLTTLGIWNLLTVELFGRLLAES